SSKHGKFCIILKDLIRGISVFGGGIMLHGFISLTRNWTKEKAKFHHQLH
ncbi:hypothetical protein C7974DRAFT_319769, partial [Boeremia exigua]